MSKRVEYVFPTDLESILKRIDAIDPVKYARSRNFIDGDVTYLSPYISRGVISAKMLKDTIFKQGYKLYQIEKFIQELAWREYWQRIWQSKGDEILNDLKQPQPDYIHRKIPVAVINHSTRIDAVDNYIEQLYQQGYMHNHVRMYLASIVCNIAKSHWLLPAQWLYYHLLDGDIASNHLSWQWTGGSASSKKYYCDQANISRYTGSNQKKSFLAESYESLAKMNVPDVLTDTIMVELTTTLPQTEALHIDATRPTCIYNSYNLDPLWRKDEDVNRVLLLEPSHFKKFPVSNKVIEFILALAKNIPSIKIFVGEFHELKTACLTNTEQIIFKEHPAFKHYKGTLDSRDWLAPNTTGNFNSFFSFWKKAEREMI
ncbi:MAG: FAD-binding domain-containing protein [Ferruginibacter sp.]